MDTAVEAKDGHVNIDVKQLMSAYDEPYKPMGEFILSSGSCIFKTPSILSRHNEKAYLPNAFSFGPWHYGEPHLMATQAIKYKYLEDILRRFPDPDKNKLAELEAAIAEVEDKARQCYAGTVGVPNKDGGDPDEGKYPKGANRHPDASGDPNKDGGDPDEGKHPDPVLKDKFVKLLVLDGCFIVELFRRYYRDASGDPNKDGGDPDEGKHPKGANTHPDASGDPNKDGGDPDEGKHPKGANRHPDASGDPNKDGGDPDEGKHPCCFIVELFRRYPKGANNASGDPNKDGGDPDEGKHPDPVFSMACMRQFLLHDLILLENQIPWFVLERLFNLTRNSNAPKASLLEIAVRFFEDHNLIEGVPSEKSPIDNGKNHPIISLLRNCMILKKKEDTSNLHNGQPESNLIEGVPSEKSLIDNGKNHHIISLLRNCMILKKNLHNGQPVRSKKGPELPGKMLLTTPLPSARKLEEYGIKFERAENRSILDIRFERGVLKIPRLFIHETTETLFRNIISFEQCYPGCSSEFTSYAKFMDNLVDKDEDMEVLIKKDVINTWLEPEAATKILNKLYQDAFFDNSFYDDQCQQVNNYCRRWWPKWRAFYVRNYFTRPWAVFSQIFAFLVLSVSILNLVLKKFAP